MTATSHSPAPPVAVDPQACLNAIHAAATSTETPWVLPAEDQLHSYLFAQRLRRFQRKLIDLARQQDPAVSADAVTVAFLEADNARFRRKAEAVLLQQSTLTRREARRLLRLTVNLHQHAPQLLDQLEAGAATVAETEILAHKLAAIQSPAKPTPQPNPPERCPTERTPEPEDFQRTLHRTEQAKDALGRELSKLAGRGLSPEDLQSRARTLRNQHHPQPPQQRQQAAHRRRHFRVTAAADGMAHLYAFIGAAEAAGIQQRLSAQAQQLRTSGQGAERSPANIEADLLVDQLLGDPVQQAAEGTAETAPHGGGPGSDEPAQQPLPTLAAPTGGGPEAPAAAFRAPAAPATTVMVLVTLTELINLGGVLDPERMLFLREHYPRLWEQAERNRCFYATAPAERQTAHPPGLLESGSAVRLLGSDLVPGTAASAELLARASVFRAILTDPVTGYPLGVGRKSYRVPRHIRELIMLRDQTCRHPGCRAPATAAEMDHVTPWVNNGNTGYAEVVAKCAEHHRGKSAGWYQERLLPDDGDGVLEFRDAAGKQARVSRPVFPLDPKAWRAFRTDNEEDPPF